VSLSAVAPFPRLSRGVSITLLIHVLSSLGHLPPLFAPVFPGLLRKKTSLRKKVPPFPRRKKPWPPSLTKRRLP
jgi:hypothetical protein